MKKEMRLIKAYGINQANSADVPHKVSGTTVSRIVTGEESGCSRCFPHGYETINSSLGNQQKCWKKHRKYQWKG